jgi:methyltransferase-like protein/2-polyprenyl-3-methyl-5-hydroxy-6-metoxy-1,4-benzoquinol methylase
MTSALRESYDELPYPSSSFVQTHPDRLATLGRLFGISPAPVDHCRILEMGCSAGGNLIPLAAALPHSDFVGIDFSATTVGKGVADIAALQLANIRLLPMDIRDFDSTFGTFDYIIAHGVYSWVPKDVQESVLAICARQLAPNGIAYISYNTLPGWHARGAVRDAMRYHTRQFTDARTRVQQARAMLDFLAQSLQSTKAPWGAMLLEEAQRVRQQPDGYIYHDHLEPVNEPVYFHEFIERASKHGLRYLAEADFWNMLARDLSPEIGHTLARIAPDLLQREQFLDFLRNRTFRQTLLTHDSVTLTRKVSPECIFKLYVSTRARPVSASPDECSGAPEVFRASQGEQLSTGRPLTKAAMMALVQNVPAAIGFDELCALAQARLGAHHAASSDDRNALASDMLQCFAAGVVELHSLPSPFVIEHGTRPEASAVAALQAGRGAQVTNLRHESIALDDDARRLLPMLTGSRDEQELATLAWPGDPEQSALEKLRQALARLARQALLIR